MKREKDESILRGRIRELAERALRQDIYEFTDFLGLMEQSVFWSLASSLSVPFESFGGAEGLERIMIRFGDAERIGYELDYPIVCLRAEAVGTGGAIGHRDVLGSLMSLGLKREMLGDILVRESGIYIFCKDVVAEFICENLVSIRNTTVLTKAVGLLPEDAGPRLLPESIQVKSPRVDAVTAKVLKLSREKAAALVNEGRIFINGRQVSGTDSPVRAGDIISLRGFGRYRCLGERGSTKKGNIILGMEKFV